jgi:hypothetical protein
MKKITVKWDAFKKSQKQILERERIKKFREKALQNAIIVRLIF